MSYVPVAIMRVDGSFVGYTIMRADAQKLQTTNIYTEGEEAKLDEQVALLNADVDIKRFWPHPQDPEVLALLADETFIPIEYKMAEMVDDEHSYYVWKQTEEVDQHGNPTGRMVDSEWLDEEASVLAYKVGKVPVKPAQELFRIQKACEVIARKRASQ